MIATADVPRVGLVFGKFMPLHKGHLALIRFARARCRRLVVFVCTQTWEPIPGALRCGWVVNAVEDHAGIEVRHCQEELPYAGRPSREISAIWGRYFAQVAPEVDAVFTSEEYGDELAELMKIRHIAFDRARSAVPVSASQIRERPLAHWDYLPPNVRPHFTKKICLYGPESVGKSTLAARLADHFQTVFVPEMARDIIADSRVCAYDDLLSVARAQATELARLLPRANRLLFCDTDLLTTMVYSRFLFGRELDIDDWIRDANRFDLHLLLESDVPYVQDGSRLGVEHQAALRAAFRTGLATNNTPHEVVTGDYEERFRQAVEIVEQRLLR